MTPQKLLAVLFFIHLYLHPATELSSLVELLPRAKLTLPVLLESLMILLHDMEIRSPQEVKVLPEEKKDIVTLLSTLQQQYTTEESEFITIFERLKKGMMLGLRNQKLLDYWTTAPVIVPSSIVDMSTRLISNTSPLWIFEDAEVLSTSSFLSAIFSNKTAVGCTVNVIFPFIFHW